MKLCKPAKRPNVTFTEPARHSLVAAGWFTRSDHYLDSLIHITADGVTGWFMLKWAYEVVANWEPAVAIAVMGADGENRRLIVKPTDKYKVETRKKEH